MKRFAARFVILCVVLLALATALTVKLGMLTLAEGEDLSASASKRMTRTVPIKGTRGRILDRNGIVLAYSEVCYNVEFQRNPDKRTEYHSAVYTEALIKAIDIIESNGGTVIDTSYIRMNEDGELYYDWGVTSDKAIKARYLNFCNAMGFTSAANNPDDMSKWTTAEKAYLSLRKSWKIPEEMSFEEAVKIFSIRQEVLLNNYRAYMPVTIAYDVSMEVVAQIEMHADELPGLQTAESSTRIYPKGMSAAHIVGYLQRSVTEEMLELGYDYSDYIGVSGLEYSMESYLTGSTLERQGSRVIEVNTNGTEIRELSYTAAGNGSDVMSTIDYELQVVTEQALDELIDIISAKQRDLIERDEGGRYYKKTNGDLESIDTATGGTIIVMDANNGEVLAMASNPSYDPTWFIEGLTDEQFEMLFGEDAADSMPMRNKAISSKLAPGSIFKMLTGMAGLMEGEITLDTRIDDKSPYIIVNADGSKITSGAPSCWTKYPSKHADQDIIKALTNSCNYFFYEVANRLGIDRLNDWASRFGFTSSTGIELPGEAVGIIGGQAVLYDNAAELSNQKTSMPRLIYNLLCSKLKSYQTLRGVAINDEEISACALRLMQLQDGTLVNKGQDARRILSEELGIPEMLTSSNTWVSDIMTLLSELQWKATLTIRSGIGQGVTLVTPIAAARYVSAIANGGTVYQAQIVDKIIDSDGVVVEDIQPTVFSTIDAPAEYWTAIMRGMDGVVSPEDGGTAANAFTKAFLDEYQAVIAGKTGTAQVGSNTIDIENTSWFVLITPRENPEIVIVVCVPNGYSGSSSAPAIEKIVTYYYERRNSASEETLPAVNGIVP